MVQGDTRRRRAFVGLSMLVMVGLAGCSQGEPPEEPTPVVVQPSPTVSTPSPSPTALVEPEKPAEWLNPTEVGALAAAQYFMDLYAYVNATGDLTEWDRLSADDCQFCSNTHADLESVYGSGGRIEGASFAVSEFTLVGFDAELRIHEVQLAFDAASGVAFSRDGDVLRNYPAESGFLVVDLGFDGGGWVLVGGDVRNESA